MALVIVLVLFLIVTVGIFWWFLKYLKCNVCLYKFPGPRPLPIIGNIHEFKSAKHILPTLLSYMKEHGNIVRVWFGFNGRLVISDEELLEDILKSSIHTDRSELYKFFQSWLGLTLFTTNGKVWSNKRKSFTPVFHLNMLKEFVHLFNIKSAGLVKKLNLICTDEAIDIVPYISECTLDVIREATIGSDTKKGFNTVYMKSMKVLKKIVVKRMFSFVKSWDFLFTLTNDYKTEQQLLKTLCDYTDSPIEMRKKQLLQNKLETTEINKEDYMPSRFAFLDCLLQNGYSDLPKIDLINEIYAVILAGFDTTATTVSFTLYCISKHPEVQEKIHQELQSIFGNDQSRSPSYNDLQDMKYLEMVIKETLRLYPPVPAIGRRIGEDIRYGGKLLPKGSSVTIFTYGLHRRADIYPNPETFDPERFLPENISTRSPYAYLPFSAGPRNCLGQRYAMVKSKCIISHVLRHYKLIGVPEHKPSLTHDTVISSDNGLPIFLKKR